MTMKLRGLFSGSTGNCILFEGGGVRLLVDAGCSGKAVLDELAALQIDCGSLDGILITHEHDDHIKGAGILSRKLNIPIYANAATHAAMRSKLGKIKEENLVVFENDAPLYFGDVCVTPFCSYHDAADPVGYVFTDGQKRIALATDLGHVGSATRAALCGADGVFLEANHDIEMLKCGPYPLYLKKRILSEVGHLSNVSSGEFAAELIEGGTEQLILGHLSRNNNTPLVALNTVCSILSAHGMTRNVDFRLSVALHDRVSEALVF